MGDLFNALAMKSRPVDGTGTAAGFRVYFLTITVDAFCLASRLENPLLGPSVVSVA